VFHQLYELWRKPGRGDEYLGTLINAWLDEGGNALGVRSGTQYVDTGTLHGYRSAVRLLEQEIPQIITKPLREEATTKNELAFANRR
jgi:glucose-1-phosphate thymidylyltransferase